MKLPARYLVPREIYEAMLVLELGFTLEALDKMPQELIDKMVIYKNVKGVAEVGGVYEP